jgi:hypothetical protein
MRDHIRRADFPLNVADRGVLGDGVQRMDSQRCVEGRMLTATALLLVGYFYQTLLNGFGRLTVHRRSRAYRLGLDKILLQLVQCSRVY